MVNLYTDRENRAIEVSARCYAGELGAAKRLSYQPPAPDPPRRHHPASQPLLATERLLCTRRSFIHRRTVVFCTSPRNPPRPKTSDAIVNHVWQLGSRSHADEEAFRKDLNGKRGFVKVAEVGRTFSNPVRRQPLHRFYFRSAVGVLGPVVVSAYFILIWRLYLAPADMHSPLAFIPPGAIHVFYSWFIAGIVGLNLSLFGLAGVEAAILMEPAWNVGDAMRLTMHADRTWSGPGGWLKMLNWVAQKPKFGVQRKLPYRLWFALVIPSTLIFIAWPFSGLFLETTQGFLHGKLVVGSNVTGFAYANFNERASTDVFIGAGVTWENALVARVPGQGIVNIQEGFDRSQHAFLNKVPNALPKDAGVPRIFMTAQSETPLEGKAWGLLFQYDYTVVNNLEEMSILKDRQTASNNGILNATQGLKSYYIQDGLSRVIIQNQTDILRVLWAGNLNAVLETAYQVRPNKSEYPGIDQERVFEMPLWQKVYNTSYGTGPAPQYNLSIDHNITGLYGAYDYRDFAYNIPKDKTDSYPRQPMTAIGVHCTSSSSVGTANISGVRSTYSNFQPTDTPINIQRNRCAKRFGNFIRASKYWGTEQPEHCRMVAAGGAHLNEFCEWCSEAHKVDQQETFSHQAERLVQLPAHRRMHSSQHHKSLCSMANLAVGTRKPILHMAYRDNSIAAASHQKNLISADIPGDIVDLNERDAPTIHQVHSPYVDSEIVSLDVGSSTTRFLVHSRMLDKSAALSALASKEQPVSLSKLDEGPAHTLVHFLYAGTFEVKFRYAPVGKFRHSTCVYCAAVQYQLPSLAELSKDKIVEASEGLHIFDILRVARDQAFSLLPETDVWYSQYLEDVIQKAMAQDPGPFRKPDFITRVEGNSRLLQIVWKTVMSNYAIISAPASIKEIGAETPLADSMITESGASTQSNHHQLRSPTESVVDNPPTSRAADELIEPQPLELDTAVAPKPDFRAQYQLKIEEKTAKVAIDSIFNDEFDLPAIEPTTEQPEVLQIVNKHATEVGKPSHMRTDSVVEEDAVAPDSSFETSKHEGISEANNVANNGIDTSKKSKKKNKKKNSVVF
ncbi:uncharacterized protein M421DRAFT_90890 [Didymella exigua CBS 183.55]|uniref:Uncharacterized protein n=1 Tax=Didymella exigua CBS 183.55 TaxID=1150837 RepID=A0A6A5RVL9_9PLEO|nr:uncharacterized protein M421DRAFT_90890 [Didymella exigua CBS 183.55]KAF1930326.1 hypothetical protein M421DRAFT_90890 [Didymella exigua CBS 183.55]